MKTPFLQSIIITAFLIVFSSCSDSSKEKQTYNATAEMTIEIDGMTCAKGCAKAIEAKVFELEGVTFSHVDFEKKIGKFKWDDALINEKDILKAISDINNGIYTVKEVKIEKKVIEKVEEKEDPGAFHEKIVLEDEASV